MRRWRWPIPAPPTENTPLTVAVGDTGTTSGTMTINANLLLNDEDVDTGDTLTITEVGPDSKNQDTANVGTATAGDNGGTFTLAANGAWTFDPDGDPDNDFDDLDAGETRTTSVVYTVSDGKGGTDTATLTVTVTGANDDPVAVDDTGRAVKDRSRVVADGATGATITVTDPDTGETGTMTVNADLLLNDGDAEGDAFTITKVAGAATNVGNPTVGTDENGDSGGLFTINANGAWTFDPDGDFDNLKDGQSRTTSVTYTVSDGTGGTATLTVTVTAANTAPVALDDAGAFTVTADNAVLTVADGATGTPGPGGGAQRVNADLLLNDSDADGDSLTITGVNGEAGSVGNAIDVTDGGVFTINADGAWEFDPDDDFDDLAAGETRTTSVQYTVFDGTDTHTATLTLTVTGINDAPVAVEDTGRAVKDRSRVVADGATGTVVTVTDDKTGETSTLAINADLLLNDSDADRYPGLDPDRDTLTITGVAGTATNVGKAVDVADGGVFTINADGAWTFNPDGDFDDLAVGATGTTSVTYTVSDGKGGTHTATLTVTVTGANAAPDAVDDAGAFTVTADNKVLTVADGATGTVTGTVTINADLLLNDTDPDGDITFTISGVKGYTDADPDDGTRQRQDVAAGAETWGNNGGVFTLNADGSWEFDPNSDFEDLARGATRTTSVEYTVSDYDGGLTDTATLTVTVTGANDPLTAEDDTGATAENDLLVVAAAAAASDTGSTNAGLLRNDKDDDGDDLSITEVDGESASVGKAVDGSNGGSFTINKNGSYTFDPGTDFDDLKDGETRTTRAQYTAADGTADDSFTDTATVTVTVTGENDAPDAVDDTGATTENTAITVADGDTGTRVGGGAQRANADLLLNDEDVEDDDLTITEVGGDTASVGSATDGSDGGSFTIEADGSWSFDPGTDFDNLKPGATRTTEVTYTVSDNNGGTDTATLTVTVTGEDDAPTLTGATGAVTEDTDVVSGNLMASGTVTATGGDAGEDQFTVETVTSSVGELEITADGAWTYKADNSHSDIQGLGAGETLTDTLTVTSADGVTTTTVTITITGVNDAPVAVDDAGGATENTQLTVADGDTGTTSGTTVYNRDLLLNDRDPDGDSLTITEVGGDAANVGSAINGSDGGSFTLRADGSWTFDPDGNKDNDFNDLAPGQTRTTSVTYTVSDGSLSSTPATLTVTVTGVNDAPTAVDDTGATAENTELTVADGATGTIITNADGSSMTINADLLLNDTDVDTGNTLTFTIAAVGPDAKNQQAANVGAATAGTDENGNAGGSFTIRADGSWEFDPGADFDDLATGATRTTSVQYTVADGNGGTDTATLTVTVTGANDGLTANNDRGTTTENTPRIVADGDTGTRNADLLLNDVDIDGNALTITEVNGDTASVGAAIDVTGGGKFTIYANGSWEFDPDGDFDDLALGATRDTSVTYTASDGSFTDTATLTVTVSRAGDTPTITGDTTGSVTEDTNLMASGTLTATGGDAGEDKFTAETVTGAYGSLTIDADGAWTYTVDNKLSTIQGLKAGATLTDTLAVTNADTVTAATVTITINGRNDAPVAVADVGATGENTPLKVAKDAKGATMTVTRNEPVVTTDDKTGDTSTTFTTGTYTGIVNAGLLLNDRDPDGDTFTIIDVGSEFNRLTGFDLGQFTDGSNGGRFKVNADGSWEFNPDAISVTDFNDLKDGETRTTQVFYRIYDGSTVHHATLTVTVTGADDVPTITGTTTGTVTEDVAPDADGNLVASGTLTATGGDRGEDRFKAQTLNGSYGTLTIEADGDWTWKALNKDAKIQGLGAGDSPTDTFTVTNADDVTTTTVTITINGANDNPTLTPATGTVTEDTAVDGDGNLVATGTVSATGGDAGEDRFMTTPATGAYGTLTIDADGAWTYKALNSQSDIQDLSPTATLTDTLTVTNADGVTTTTVIITINGDDDMPTLTADTGAVTEDTGLVSGNLEAGGTVGATGGDDGEDQFKAESLTGTYGTLTIDADGDWTFTADNSDSKIQGLKATDSPTDTFTVTSADMVTTTTVTITINGDADARTLTPSTGGVTEDMDVVDANGKPVMSDAAVVPGNLMATGMVISGGDAGDDQFTAETQTGAYGKLEIDADGAWTWTADNKQSEIQQLHQPGITLRAGQASALTDTFTVSSADGATTTTVTITITGADDTPVITGDATGGVTEDLKANAADILRVTGRVSISGGDAGENTFVGLNENPADPGSIGLNKLAAADEIEWVYQLVNTLPQIQGLKGGETLTNDYTIRGDDGARFTVTITITGADDAPTLTASTGAVTEDADADLDSSGKNLEATGKVGATGGDTGDDRFMAETKTSSVGSLEIKTDGAWTYTARNSQPDIQGLNTGETLTDTFTVTSADTVTTTTVTITINGDDDPVTGVTGAVTEDTDADADDNLVATGTIFIDGTAGQFTAETVSGTVGSLTIDAVGAWTYKAANSRDEIQGLEDGETLIDTLTVTSADGATTTTVTITITGADDAPEAVNDAGGTTENAELTVADGDGDSASPDSDLLLNDTDAEGDSLTITEVDGKSANIGKAIDGSNGGTFTIESNGAWTFDPDGNKNNDFNNLKAGETRTTSVVYTVSDGSLTDTATVTVTVTGTNDGLTANDDTGATAENAPLTVADGATGTTSGTNADLLLNDKDIDTNDILTISGVKGYTDAAQDGTRQRQDVAAGAETFGKNGGTFTIRADGSWEFNPGTDFDDLKAGVTRTTSVEYTASDGTLTDTATLTVTVTGANDGLTANDDTGRTSKDRMLSVANDAAGGDKGLNADLLLNDVDIDGDDLTITEVGGESSSVGKATAGTDEDGNAGGSFTIRADGSWEFNPGTDFNDLKDGETRTTSVEYTASDGSLTDTATVTVTVAGANSAPEAKNDVGAATGNTQLTVADGDKGTEITNADSSTMTINADLLLNDIDIDGDDLTITEVGGDTASVGKAIDVADGGKFTIDSKGGWTFDPDGDFDDLAAGATRTTSVVYTASDGSLTDTATLTVTVTGADSAPEAKNDVGATTENTKLTVADGDTGTTSTATDGADLLLNDTGDSLTISAVGSDEDSQQAASVGKAVNGSNGGSFTIDSKGGWTFDPDDDFDDLADGKTRTTSVTYTVSDGSLTDTATLTVTVTGENDDPTLTPATGMVTEDKALTSGNLVVTGTVATEGGDAGEDKFMTATTPPTGAYGSLTITAGGDWTYTADNSDSKIQGLKATDSPTDTFTVTSADGVTKTTVTITIRGADDVPTLTPAKGEVTEDAKDASGNLVATGTVATEGGDAGDTQFKPETISVTGTHYGSLKIEADGDWTYTADNSDSKIQGLKATDSPTDTFTVTSADGVTKTTVTITINGVDDAPMLTADTGTVTEDVADADDKLVTTGTVGASGGDAGDTQFKPETISVTGTHYGSLKIEADGDWTYTADNSDSKIQGLKATDSPTDTFTVTSADGVTTTMVTITINGVNDAPMLEADAALTAENDKLTVADGTTATTITVTDDKGNTITDDKGDTITIIGNADLLINDVDIDGDDLKITKIFGFDDQGKAKIVAPGAVVGGSAGGQFTVSANGAWSFNPGTDFDYLKAGGTFDTLVAYTVSDGNGEHMGSLTVRVVGVDDAPMLTADTGTVTEDAEDASGNLVATGTVGASGGDAGDTQFKPETISVTGTHYGSLKIEADGDWTYTADNSDSKIQGLKATDSPTDTFTVTSADMVTTTMVTITINGVDDAPMLTADTGTVTEDAEDASGNLVATGTVGASGGDAGDTQFKPETISVTGTHYGSLKIEADGDWTYTADNSDSKIQGLKATDSPTDTFTVTSADMVTTTSVTITINGANDAPVAKADAGVTAENTKLTVADGATATPTIITDDKGSTSTITGNADLLLNDSDPDGDTFTITGVKGYTRNPDGSYKAQEDAVAVIKDGTAATPPTPAQTSTLGSSGGTFTLYADGSYTFDPGTDFDDLKGGATRTTSVEYTVFDGSLTDTATLTVTVTGANDALVTVDDAGATTENKMLKVANDATGTTSGTTTTNADLLLNDVDIDGDDLTITEVGGDTASVGSATAGDNGGSFTISTDGSWSFDPGTDFDDLKAAATETTSVVYTVSDGTATNTATLTVTVTGEDDAPSLTPATGGVTEDLAVDDNGDLVATGKITATGGDAGDDQFRAGSQTGSYGSLTLATDGAWTWKADNSQTDIQELHQPGITLRAGQASALTDTFTVTSADGVTTTTVTITITGADDTPTITGAATGGVTEDLNPEAGTGILRVTGRVNIGDGDSGENTFTGVNNILSDPGSMRLTDLGGGVGEWEYQLDNTLPEIQGLKAGETLTNVYTVRGGDGTSFSVTITITGTDDVPVLTASTVTLGEDVAVVSGNLVASGTVSSSDGDDGESGFMAETVTGSVGSLTIDAAGAWSYTAANSQPDIQGLKAGETLTDTLTVTSADTVTTTTVTITINGANDAPVAADDTGNTAENTPLTVADGGTGTTNADLLLNDTDPDGDDLTITEVAGDTANVGSATTGDNGGSFTIRADGSWRFDPGSDFDGLAAGATATTSVQYTASDGTLTDTATLTVTVTGEADAPSLTAATATVTEDVAVVSGNLVASGTVGSSGGDAGESRFRAETVTGDYGSLRIDASGDWRYTAANSQSAIQGLSATDSLSDAFTVTSADRVTTTTVTITINGADDTPSLTAATGMVTEDNSVNANGDLVASGTVGSSGGDAGESRFRAETLSGDYGSLRIDASGDWRYTAANSQSAIQGLSATDSLTDAFTVTSADRVTTTMVAITINGADDGLPPPAVNEAPTATDDAGSTVADTVLTVAGEATGSAGVNAGLLLNDVDIDGDRLSITTVAGFSRDAEGNYQPLQEAVAAGTPTLGSNGGQFTIEADGSWRFDPDADFDDLAPDATRTTALTYTVSDGNGGTDTATLTVTIRGADDVPPTLVTDTVVTGTGSAPTAEPALSTIDPAAPPSEAGLRSPDAEEDADEEADSDNFLVPDQFWGTADDPDPVRLGISLDEQRIPAQGSSTIVLPSNTFVHVDPGTLIRVEASLEDGSDLPGYVIFDPDTLSFEVDGEAAAAAGVGELTVLLTGRDAAGNSDFGVFVINLRDVEEDTEDEPGAGQLPLAADASPAATEADGGELEESGDAGSAATDAENQTETDGNEPEQSDAATSEAGQASAENNEKDGQEQAAAQKNFDSQLEQVSRNNFMDSIEQLLEDVKTLLL